MIRYKITLSQCHKHLYKVVMIIDEPLDKQEIILPNWLIGSYKIRDFCKNINELKFNTPYTQTAKNRFVCDTFTLSDHLEISYTVYAREKTVRTAYLDCDTGFFNPSNILFSAIGKETTSHHVCIDAHYFKVHTTLPLESGEYIASSYDELIDHPFVCTTEETSLHFDAKGISHEAVFTEGGHTDTTLLTTHLEQICTHHIELFGEYPHPSNSYSFYTLCTAKNYGGLEHRNSTLLIIPRKDIDNTTSATKTTLAKDYIRFLSLCAHEYFHTWWVKTLKPKAFHAHTLDHEIDTSELWIFEGITSYYDDLSLAKAGILSSTEYLSILENNINKLLKNSGRTKQSLIQASQNAWTKLYQADESFTTYSANYYNGAGVMLFVLDTLLRKHSEHTLTLDAFVQHLYHSYKESGITNKEFASELTTYVASHTTTSILCDFYETYINGTTELPLTEVLEYCGIEVNTQESKLELGALIKDNVITLIHEGSTLEQSKVYVGDTIISIDGYEPSHFGDDFNMSSYTSNDELVITVLRDGRTISTTITLLATPYTQYALSFNAEKSEKTKEYTKQWLSATVMKQ